ncbi:uncharacterized protein LOC129616949 [Condylostylus longicornis]|uniref:uncharacterized protein LOC129616949 n=1 Tax=Condylostylus longicornis TaxID=2530218 RepID=UPI00244DA337|nr:uncharacterized protein LOC129616949 [Condylostylus longicornis]
MEDSIKKILKKQEPIGTSSEDEILASSQEAGVSIGGDETSKVAKPPEQSTQKAKGTSHSSKSKKSKGPAFVLKKRYSKAVFILGKIAQNEAEGKTSEKDAEDKVKYQKVIDEYNAYKNTKPQETTKRVRSQDDDRNAQESKRSKVVKPGTTRPSTSSGNCAQGRTMSEVVRDHLQFGVVDRKSTNLKLSSELWCKVEAKLSEMVVEHLLTTDGNEVLSFDSSEVVRGYRVIKCEDRLSGDFLSSCVAKISDTWDGSKVELIPAKEIPRRPRARIWIPKMNIAGDKLLKVLKIANPEVPMDDWQIIKKEEPQKNSESFLLLINEESLQPLDRRDNRLRFGIRHAKLKIFRSADPEGDAIEEASQLFGQMEVADKSKSDEGNPG